MSKAGRSGLFPVSRFRIALSLHSIWSMSPEGAVSRTITKATTFLPQCPAFPRRAPDLAMVLTSRSTVLPRKYQPIHFHHALRAKGPRPTVAHFRLDAGAAFSHDPNAGRVSVTVVPAPRLGCHGGCRGGKNRTRGSRTRCRRCGQV